MIETPTMSAAPGNVFSIDLEDWFCVSNLSQVIRFENWDRQESRIEASTLRLLDVLSRHRVESTVFVLGWVAQRFPDLIREIERRGHEIATHGYSHRLLTHMTQPEFEDDLQKALEVTARCVGQPVRGFRAPSFSLTPRTPWVAEVLAKHGIRYDSSVFPIRFHPDYGMPGASLDAYSFANGLLEVPLSCAQVAGQRIPCSGGGYFRLLPYPLTRNLMRRCQAQGRPVIFYLHPWEVDPGQPRVHLSRLKAFRHYTNLHRTLPRLERLLADFRFTSFRALYSSRF